MIRSWWMVVVLAALMAVSLVGAASAAIDNWRIVVKADNGAELNPSPGAQGGVYPTAVDEYNSALYDDGTAYTGLSADTAGTGMHVATYFEGISNVFGKNIKGPGLPKAGSMRTWEFLIAAGPNSSNTVIRPRMYTVSCTTLPYAADNLKYRLVLIDNKGMVGSPANGTYWELPVPSVSSSTIPFWEMPQSVLLPIIKLSGQTNEALLAEGYRFQLQQINTDIAVGTLTAAILPPEAVSDGARWKRLGTSNWLDSGETESLPVGDYTVEFEDIAGWTEPAAITLTVVVEETTQVTGEYSPEYGSLRVIIGPPGALNAGGQWRRVGTAEWHNSGDTENEVRTGSYAVEFSGIPAWIRPAGVNVTINKDLTTEVTSIYLPGEDFESGNMSEWPWQTGGSAGWTVSTDSPHEGAFCARAGAIADSESTYLEITLTRDAGDVSFFRRVSCEQANDSMRFSIDGLEKEHVSGDIGWGQQTFPVEAGTHTYRWEYVKDGTASTGEDSAWIDYVCFPPGYPPPAPTVDSIDPAVGANMGTVTARIAGMGFGVRPSVRLAGIDQPDIVGSVVTQTAAEITCTLNLTGAETGLWDVVLTNPDGQSGSVPGGFTVFAPPEAPAVSDDGRHTTDRTSLHASWLPVSGAAEYQYSIETSGGTAVVPWTPCGTDTEKTVTGVSLQVGETYYWRVKAANQWAYWGETGSSDGISAAYAATISQAKGQYAGSLVLVSDAVVTSASSEFPGLWASAADRSAGLRIPGGIAAARGERLLAAGTVQWVDGVPTLVGAGIESMSSGTPLKALSLNSRDLATDRGERLDYAGVNPVGLLVTAWGQVTKIDTANKVFYVDDGKGLADGMGPSYDPFVGIRVAYTTGITPPLTGKYVLVSGIRSVQPTTLSLDAIVNGEYRLAGETLYLPLIVLRSQSDIVIRK